MVSPESRPVFTASGLFAADCVRLTGRRHLIEYGNSGPGSFVGCVEP